jgi:uncharacterized Zn finger protein
VSDWDSFRRFRSGPKRPPPEHGIRMKKAGTTWWGQRWIEALEHVLGAEAGRLGRGKTYARAGRTHDLVVRGGTVTAKVTGSRPTPYKVRIELSQLGEEQWRAAIAGMAAKAQFSAELLAGQMPRAIDEVFQTASASLFPTGRAELVTSCSCPDWGDPCKHVAATHYVLGEALDRDPFLLFELRGRTQAEVLDALRAARAGGVAAGGVAAEPGGGTRLEPEVPAVTIGPSADDYDRLRAPLPALAFSFDEPQSHGALLRQLGAPPSWGGTEGPGAVFEEWIRDAAGVARRIALGEAAEAEDASVLPLHVEVPVSARGEAREARRAAKKAASRDRPRSGGGARKKAKKKSGARGRER